MKDFIKDFVAGVVILTIFGMVTFSVISNSGYKEGLKQTIECKLKGEF